MPWIERVISNVNLKFGPENRANIDPEMFTMGRSLTSAFRHVGIEDDERVWSALEAFPNAIAEAFKAAVYSGLVRDEQGAITIAWIASYDYGLEVYESQSFDGSPAGLTIVVRSRYPFDRHPAQRRGTAL